VFCELKRLDEMGFKTWISSVRELALRYDVILDSYIKLDIFKQTWQSTLTNKFISDWQSEVNDYTKNPILRTHRLFKTNFGMKPYLYIIKSQKYRAAISKLRASSHMLEIERGRHTRPVTPLDKRLCPKCNSIEDETHFVLDCNINKPERLHLFNKIHVINPYFKDMSPMDKFVYLLTINDDQITKWFSQFVYHSFEKRCRLS